MVESLLLALPDTPLLSRWKGFEVAAAYSLRGLLFYGLLPQVLRKSLGKIPGSDKLNATCDLDVEVAPAIRQQIRGRKCLDMLVSEDAAFKLGQALRLSEPLALYMNEVSQADTVSLAVLHENSNMARAKAIELNAGRTVGLDVQTNNMIGVACRAYFCPLQLEACSVAAAEKPFWSDTRPCCAKVLVRAQTSLACQLLPMRDGWSS